MPSSLSKQALSMDIALAPIDANFLGRRKIPCSSENPCFIQLIADLDHKSKQEGHDDKPTYISKLLTGRLSMDGEKKAKVEWYDKEPMNVVGRIAEEGRGMELSELVLFNRSMYAFDDRTGIVYELMARKAGELRGAATELSLAELLEPVRTKSLDEGRAVLQSATILPVAKVVLAEGDGRDSPKGMKIEWACEKNGALHVGSFGKEYTTPDGAEIVGTANFWIAQLHETKQDRVDWTDNYNRLRSAVNATFPGYLIHEAVNWSPYYRKWFFLPRRISSEPYDEQKDETRGANKILITSPEFDEIHVVDVAFPQQKPERGFSSFKFVPGTNDRIIIAIRSAENEAQGTQETFLSLFTVDGTMITNDEIQVSDTFKFEGLEVW